VSIALCALYTLPQEPLLFSHPRFRDHANYGASTRGKYFSKGGTIVVPHFARVQAVVWLRRVVRCGVPRLFPPCQWWCFASRSR
jgi:hypothetical protein